MNRCVTKTRSTAFKFVTANLTAYQNQQLIPVSLFGKVVLADTIQIEIEYATDHYDENIEPDFNVVLINNGKEYYCADIHYTNATPNDIFKTYEWAYNDSFITKTNRETLDNGKKRIIQNINLKKVKKIIGDKNNATIQFKMKRLSYHTLDSTITYKVKLLADGEQKYYLSKTKLFPTYNIFLVDVFFNDLFELTYDYKNDLFTVLSDSDYIPTTMFEYDLLIKKNQQTIVNEHMLTNAMPFTLNLKKNEFKTREIISFEVKNFKIKLSMPDGRKKVITPDFIIPLKNRIIDIEHYCILNVIKFDKNNYIGEILFLEPHMINIDEETFSSNNLGFCKFNSFQDAFLINIFTESSNDTNHKSFYVYYDNVQNVKNIPITKYIF